MRFEIKDVQRRLGITVIYVTHDQAEAMVMSDRIIVMDRGLIQQSDVPRAIYEHPANKFVADFIGLINFIDSTVVSRTGDTGVVELKGIDGAVRFTTPLRPGLRPGDATILAIRPESITISQSSGPEAIKGKVIRKVYLGNEVDYRVAVADLEVRVTADPAADDVAEGQDVWLSFHRVFAIAN